MAAGRSVGPLSGNLASLTVTHYGPGHAAHVEAVHHDARRLPPLDQELHFRSGRRQRLQRERPLRKRPARRITLRLGSRHIEERVSPARELCPRPAPRRRLHLTPAPGKSVTAFVAPEVMIADQPSEAIDR
jgi:hypothetical protein